CHFYHCSYIRGAEESRIYVLGCTSDDGEFLSELGTKVEEDNVAVVDDSIECAVYILEKFWPKGRPTFIKHRPIKGLCVANNKFSHSEVLSALTFLKKRGYLIEPDKASFLELNIESLPEIRSMLGRS